MASSTPTVMVIATVHWASTTRLCLALAEGGLRVLALVPPHHALHRLDTVETMVLGRRRGRAIRDIFDMLASRSVDLVVPADERAIDLVRGTHARAAANPNIAGLSHIAGLIERSLGSASAFTLGGRKSRFVALAREEALPCPPPRWFSRRRRAACLRGGTTLSASAEAGRHIRRHGRAHRS